MKKIVASEVEKLTGHKSRLLKYLEDKSFYLCEEYDIPAAPVPWWSPKEAKIDRFYYLTFERQLINLLMPPRSHPQKVEVLLDFDRLNAIKNIEYVKTDNDGEKLPAKSFGVTLVLENNTEEVEDVPLDALNKLKESWVAWRKQNPEVVKKNKD